MAWPVRSRLCAPGISRAYFGIATNSDDGSFVHSQGSIRDDLAVGVHSEDGTMTQNLICVV